jgi:hypothetical protein
MRKPTHSFKKKKLKTRITSLSVHKMMFGMFAFMVQWLLFFISIKFSFKEIQVGFCIYFPFLWFFQLLRPIYKQIAENQNAEIFSANTLLVILGTSLLTARV